MAKDNTYKVKIEADVEGFKKDLLQELKSVNKQVKKESKQTAENATPQISTETLARIEDLESRLEVLSENTGAATKEINAEINALSTNLDNLGVRLERLDGYVRNIKSQTNKPIHSEIISGKAVQQVVDAQSEIQDLKDILDNFWDEQNRRRKNDKLIDPSSINTLKKYSKEASRTVGEVLGDLKDDVEDALKMNLNIIFPDTKKAKEIFGKELHEVEFDDFTAAMKEGKLSSEQLSSAIAVTKKELKNFFDYSSRVDLLGSGISNDLRTEISNMRGFVQEAITALKTINLGGNTKVSANPITIKLKVDSDENLLKDVNDAIDRISQSKLLHPIKVGLKPADVKNVPKLDKEFVAGKTKEGEDKIVNVDEKSLKTLQSYQAMYEGVDGYITTKQAEIYRKVEQFRQQISNALRVRASIQKPGVDTDDTFYQDVEDILDVIQQTLQQHNFEIHPNLTSLAYDIQEALAKEKFKIDVEPSIDLFTAKNEFVYDGTSIVPVKIVDIDGKLKIPATLTYDDNGDIPKPTLRERTEPTPPPVPPEPPQENKNNMPEEAPPVELDTEAIEAPMEAMKQDSDQELKLTKEQHDIVLTSAKRILEATQQRNKIIAENKAKAAPEKEKLAKLEAAQKASEEAKRKGTKQTETEQPQVDPQEMFALRRSIDGYNKEIAKVRSEQDFMNRYVGVDLSQVSDAEELVPLLGKYLVDASATAQEALGVTQEEYDAIRDVAKQMMTFIASTDKTISGKTAERDRLYGQLINARDSEVPQIKSRIARAENSVTKAKLQQQMVANIFGIDSLESFKKLKVDDAARFIGNEILNNPALVSELNSSKERFQHYVGTPDKGKDKVLAQDQYNYAKLDNVAAKTFIQVLEDARRTLRVEEMSKEQYDSLILGQSMIKEMHNFAQIGKSIQFARPNMKNGKVNFMPFPDTIQNALNTISKTRTGNTLDEILEKIRMLKEALNDPNLSAEASTSTTKELSEWQGKYNKANLNGIMDTGRALLENLRLVEEYTGTKLGQGNSYTQALGRLFASGDKTGVDVIQSMVTPAAQNFANVLGITSKQIFQYFKSFQLVARYVGADGKEYKQSLNYPEARAEKDINLNQKGGWSWKALEQFFYFMQNGELARLDIMHSPNDRAMQMSYNTNLTDAEIVSRLTAQYTQEANKIKQNLDTLFADYGGFLGLLGDKALNATQKVNIAKDILLNDVENAYPELDKSKVVNELTMDIQGGYTNKNMVAALITTYKVANDTTKKYLDELFAEYGGFLTLMQNEAMYAKQKLEAVNKVMFDDGIFNEDINEQSIVTNVEARFAAALKQVYDTVAAGGKADLKDVKTYYDALDEVTQLNVDSILFNRNLSLGTWLETLEKENWDTDKKVKVLKDRLVDFNVTDKIGNVNADVETTLLESTVGKQILAHLQNLFDDTKSHNTEYAQLVGKYEQIPEYSKKIISRVMNGGGLGVLLKDKSQTDDQKWESIAKGLFSNGKLTGQLQNVLTNINLENSILTRIYNVVNQFLGERKNLSRGTQQQLLNPGKYKKGSIAFTPKPVVPRTAEQSPEWTEAGSAAWRTQKPKQTGIVSTITDLYTDDLKYQAEKKALEEKQIQLENEVDNTNKQLISYLDDATEILSREFDFDFNQILQYNKTFRERRQKESFKNNWNEDVAEKLLSAYFGETEARQIRNTWKGNIPEDFASIVFKRSQQNAANRENSIRSNLPRSLDEFLKYKSTTKGPIDTGESLQEGFAKRLNEYLSNKRNDLTNKKDIASEELAALKLLANMYQTAKTNNPDGILGEMSRGLVSQYRTAMKVAGNDKNQQTLVNNRFTLMRNMFQQLTNGFKNFSAFEFDPKNYAIESLKQNRKQYIDANGGLEQAQAKLAQSGENYQEGVSSLIQMLVAESETAQQAIDKAQSEFDQQFAGKNRSALDEQMQDSWDKAQEKIKKAVSKKQAIDGQISMLNKELSNKKDANLKSTDSDSLLAISEAGVIEKNIEPWMQRLKQEEELKKQMEEKLANASEETKKGWKAKAADYSRIGAIYERISNDFNSETQLKLNNISVEYEKSITEYIQNVFKEQDEEIARQTKLIKQNYAGIINQDPDNQETLLQEQDELIKTQTAQIEKKYLSLISKKYTELQKEQRTKVQKFKEEREKLWQEMWEAPLNNSYLKTWGEQNGASFKDDVTQEWLQKYKNPKEWLANQEDIVQYLAQEGRKSVRENLRQKIMDEIAKKNASTAKSNDLLVQEQNRIKDGVSAVQARMNTLEADTNLDIDAELQVEANNIKNTFDEWIVAVARKAEEQLRAKLFKALETAYQTKDISSLQDAITEYDDVLGNIYTQYPTIIDSKKGKELSNFFTRVRAILDMFKNYIESIKVPGKEGNKQPVKGFTSVRIKPAVALSEVNTELDRMDQQKPDTKLMNYLLWAYRRAPVYKAKGAENQYKLGYDRIKELDDDVASINRDIDATKNEKLGPEQILQQRQQEAEKQGKKVVEIQKSIKAIKQQLTEKEKFITEKETALAEVLQEIETSTDDDFKQTKTTGVEGLQQELANARKEQEALATKRSKKEEEYKNESNVYKEKQSAVEEAKQVVKKYDGEIKSLEEEIKLRDAEKAILEERLKNLRLQLIQKGNKELITDADYENAYKETQTLKHDLDIYKARSQEAGEEVKTLQNEIASVEQDRKDNRYRQYIGAKHTEIAKRIKIEEAQDIAAKREWARQNGININEFERDLANKIGARAWREAEARAADPKDKSILSQEDWLNWQNQRLEKAMAQQKEANDMQLKLKAQLTNIADWFGVPFDELEAKLAEIHKQTMVEPGEGARMRQAREQVNAPATTEDSSTLPPINNADVNITNANVNLGGAANRGQTKGDATPISDETQSALGALRTALDDLSRGASFDDLEMNSGDVYQALAKVEKGQISNSLSQILGISGRELDEAVQDFMMDVLTSLSQTEFEKFANDRLNNSNKKSIFMQKFEEMYGQPETPSPSQSAVPTQYPEQQIQLGNVDAGNLVITAQNVTINSSAPTKTSEDLYKETVAKTNRWIDKQDLSSLDSILAPIEQMKSVITDKTADATMIVKARWALSELLRKYQKTHEGSNADGTMSRGDLKAAMNGSDNETLAWAAKFYHNGYIGPDRLTKNLAETIKPSVATGDGDWAKETTLIKTNEILNRIVEALKTKRNVGSAGKDSEPPKENSAKEISAPGKLKTTAEETVKKLNEGKDDNEKFAVVAQTYDDKAKKLTQTLVNAKEEARQIIYTFKEIDEPIDVATKEIFNFSAVTKRAFKEVGNTATTLREDFNGILFPDNAKVGEYEQAVQELQEELNKTGENGVTDIETANRIENLTLKVKQLRTEIQGMIKEAKNAPENIGDDVVRSELEKNAELTLATGNYAGYTLVGETFDEKNKQLTQKLQDANGKTLQLTYTFQGLGKQAKVTAKEMYNFGSVLVKATKEAGANANTLEQQMDGFFMNPTKMSQYNTAKQKLQQLLQEANTNGITDSSTADKITQQTEAVAKLRSELQSMIKEAQKAKENAYAIDVIGNDDKQTPDVIKQKMTEAAEAYNKASIDVKDFKEKKDALTGTTYKLVYAIETEKGQVMIATDEFDMMSNSIRRLGSDTQSTAGFFDNFFRGLRAKVGQLLQYYSASEMIRRSFYQIRQGVQYVREIDLALTELKKVTDETDESYQRFLKDMSKTASAVGSTVKDLVNSSADWARLGYNMKDAGELAKTTAVLLNVSEFESVDDATSALVSTLQAFTEDGQDVGKRAEEIVDVLNNIGNKYPVATNELAEGLQTSSAALVAANNSIEEQVAMLAAGNATMQDVSTVAAGLKIVAARLRGTTSDIDDEADSAVTNVSKLQAKVKALTAEANGGEGIDIINENGEYKSTYEILKEISKIFDKMDDVSSASLLELIAGKNRSSIVAAILQNTEILEGAYTDALDSAGSAAHELDTYLNSIQGRIDQFTNATQTMWMNFISSDAIKFIVDLGTQLMKLFDKIGFLGKLFTAVFAGKLLISLKKIEDFHPIKNLFDFALDPAGKINNITKSVEGLATSMQKLSSMYNMQNIFAMFKKPTATGGTISSIDFMAELAGYDELADKLPNIASLLEGTTVLTNEQAMAFVKNQLASMGLNEELQTTILANLSLSTAEGTSTVTTVGFSAAIKGLATSFLALLKASLPFIAKLALLGLAIYGVVKIADALIYTHKEAIEDLQNTTTEISNLTSELESLNDELSTTKDRIEELENKGPLTLTEQEELENLKKQNAELERQIQLEEYRLKIEQQKQATNAISAMNTDGNISGIDPSESMYVQIARLITGKTGIESDIDDLEKINNKVVKAQQALYDADSKGLDKSSKEYQSLLDNLTSAEESLAKKQQEIESTFKSANDDYLSTPYFEGDNLTEDQKTWNQYKSWAEDQEDRIQVILGEVGAKNNALNRILGENGTDAAKSFMDAFQNQVDDGQININTSKFENSQAAIDSATDSVEALMANNPEFKAQLDYIGISAEELARHLMDIHEGISATNEAINIAVTDLTSLKSAYDEYASVLQLVNEATFDGQAISEDMYESLKSYLNDVTVGEEDFSDAIDVTNGKVIKNTKLLRSLISQKKKEQKVTIAAARAQTQLQYTKLVKQLRTAIKAMALDYKAYGYVTQATYKNIDALRDQIKTIQQAIKQYTLLELKMSDMTNAYENFETAKELDAELTYGDSWLEAIEATSNGFITGQVSTETFKAAIDLLVPEEAYEGLEDYQDQLIAMHDYIDKNPLFANWFTIDDGNFSIEFSNIQKFVEDMLGAGVFTGDVTAFDFSAGVESMDDIVRLTKEYNGGIGVTKETLVAMFTELSKYDGRWGDILSELLMTAPERAYTQTITALDIAIAKQEQFFREGKNPDGADATEYQSILQEITDCSLAATKAKEELVSSTSAWMTANDNLDAAKQKVEKLKQDLQSLNPNENAAEIKVKTEELTQAQQEVAQCQASLDGLEEPTQVGIQLTLNDVNDQIEQWKKENQYLAVEVIPKLEKDENGELKIPATIEATLTDEEKAKLQEGIALYNTQNKYGEVLESDPIVSGLSQLNETASGIYDIISKDDKDKMAASSSDDSQEGSMSESYAYEDKFGATLGPIFESIANSPSVEYFKDVLSGLDELSNFLGDGFVDIKNNFVNEWSNIFAETGKNITDFLQWAEEFNFTEDVIQPIRDKFTELNDGFNAWADEYINKPFDDMIQSVNAWAEEFSLSEDVVQPIKEKLKEAQDSLVNWVGEHIGVPLSNLVQRINAWAEEFSFSDDVIAPIKERLQNSSNEIVQWFITDFAHSLGNFVGNIDAFIEDPAGYLQENLVPILRNICKQVDDWLDINVTEPLENIVKKINKFIDDFSFSEDVVKPIKEKFNAINQDFNDWIDEKISKPLGEIVDKINKWAEEFSFKEDVINPIKDKYKEISSVINNWLNEHISEPLSRAVQNLNDWAAEFSFKEDVLIPIQQRLTSFVKGIIDSANAWLDEHISEPAYEIVAHINQFCADFPNKFHTAIGTIDTWLDEHIWEPIDTIKEDISTFFTNLPGKLKEIWDNAWAWFVDKVNIFKLNWNAGYEEANPSESGESGGSGATGIGQAQVTGNAHAKGNKTLLAEVGTEMVVDPNRGIYYTVGENGPEMVNLPHGAIVFNHKQTKDLLENGHTGARGKITDSAALNQALGGSALATGNAYPLGNGTAAHGLFGGYVYLNDTGVAYKNGTDYYDVNADWEAAADALSGAADDLSDAADDFEDTINWIEILFNRIDNIISEQELLLELQVDNVAANDAKKANYDTIFGTYNTKYYKSLEASKYYYNKAMEEMANIPAEYVEKIKNGTIQLEDFSGKENEALVEKINKATEYYDSFQTYTIQAYQTIVDIQAKAKEQFDDVQQAYDNERGLNERFLDRVDAMNSLTENIKGFGAKTYLEQEIKTNETILEQYQAQRDALAQTLADLVAAQKIEMYSQDWYDMVNAIYDVDDAIIDTQSSIEDLQNSINDLHWDYFDELINRFGYLEDEIGNIVQLLSHDVNGLIKEELSDLTSNNWANDSGLTTLGLYAQQMEEAQYVANQYGQAIQDLKKDYAAGRYNETEYLSKLNELISAQYENISQYYDARDAIVELNETRVDAIKDGIQKEIDAYEELINKKKEELDVQKEAHDFQNEIAEKEKDVANLKKQLAAMSGDTTAATTAKRKQLEAELLEAQKALEESYYDHSITSRQDALDKEFSSFEEEKNKEMENWDEYLKNVDTVVTDSLNYVQSQTQVVYNTLNDMGRQYGLTLTDSITTPWKNGATAIDDYSATFKTACSNWTVQLDAIKTSWQNAKAEVDAYAQSQIDALNVQMGNTQGAGTTGNTNNNNNNNNTQQPVAQPKPATPSLSVGSTVQVKSSATNFSRDGGNGTKMQSWVPGHSFYVRQVSGNEVLISTYKTGNAYTGWVRKTDLVGFSRGSLGVPSSGLAILDELGEELQLVPSSQGRLEYIKKGTGIVPSDLTEKIVNLATDPVGTLSDMIPKTQVPSIETKDFNFEFKFDSLLHVDNASQDSIPAMRKMVREEFNNMMGQVNSKLKRA